MPVAPAAHQRIEMNRTSHLDGMLVEPYQQPNPLPSHSKYAMRMREPENELHRSMRFSTNNNEPERILAAVEQNSVRRKGLRHLLCYGQTAGAEAFCCMGCFLRGLCWCSSLMMSNPSAGAHRCVVRTDAGDTWAVRPADAVLQVRGTAGRHAAGPSHRARVPRVPPGQVAGA
eukprot:SAG11_NODE_2915_length_2841_cov_1.755653_3_plen_173_part_00